MKSKKITLINKKDINLIEKWEKDIIEKGLEVYNFDTIEVDFEYKRVTLIDNRYYADDKFKNQNILAPFQVDFSDINLLTINLDSNNKKDKK